MVRTSQVAVCLLALAGASAVMMAQGGASQAATLKGRVVVDTLMKPIAGAEVRIADLPQTVATDSKGAFLIEGIPAGTYIVTARKIGYAMYQSAIRFEPGPTVERPIVLPRLSPLDTVRVVGDANVPLSVLEHRAAGLGHFVTRVELEAQGNRKLSDVLALVPGLGVVQGRNNQGWVLSKRYAVPLRSIRSNNPCAGAGGSGPGCAGNQVLGEPVYYPEAHELALGLKIGCYAHVYLDATLLNPGIPAPPINVNDFF